MLTGTENASNGSSVAASQDRDQAAMQERARQLLEQRRQDPNAPHYSPAAAAAMKERGRQLLQEHQQQQQQQQDSQGSSLRAPPTAVAHSAADREAAGETEGTFSQAEVEKVKEDLIAQFNAHMMQCEQDNQAYWQQTTEHHMQELEAIAAERDAARQQLAVLSESMTADREALGRLQADLIQAQGLAKEMEGRCHQLEATNHALMEELATARNAVARLQGEDRAAQEAMDRLTRELAEARAEVSHLQAELASATANAQQQQQQQVASLEALLAQDRDTISSLEATKQSMQAENEQLQSQLTNERERGAARAEETRSLREQLTDLGGAKAAVAQERLALQLALDELQQQHRQLQQNYDQQQQQQQQREHQSPSTKSRGQNPFNPFLDDDIEEPAKEDDEAQIQQLQALVKEAEARADIAEGRAVDLQARLEAAMADLRDAEDTRDLLERDGDETQRLLDDERAERQKLEAQVAELQAAAAATRQTSEADDPLLSGGRGNTRSGNPFTNPEEPPLESTNHSKADDRVRELEQQLVDLQHENETLRELLLAAERLASTEAEARQAAAGHPQQPPPAGGQTPPPTYEDSTGNFAPPPVGPDRSSNPFATAATLTAASGGADVGPPLNEDMLPPLPQAGDGEERLQASQMVQQLQEDLDDAKARVQTLEAERDDLAASYVTAQRQVENLEAEVGVLRDQLQRDEAKAAEPSHVPEHRDGNRPLAGETSTSSSNPFAELADEEKRTAQVTGSGEGSGNVAPAQEEELERLRDELDSANRRISNMEAELALALAHSASQPRATTEEGHESAMPPAMPSRTAVVAAVTAPINPFASGGRGAPPVATAAPPSSPSSTEEADEVAFAFPDDTGVEEKQDSTNGTPPPLVKSANPFAALDTPVGSTGRRDSLFDVGDGEHHSAANTGPTPPQAPQPSSAPSHTNPFQMPPPLQPQPSPGELVLGTANTSDNDGVADPTESPVTDEGDDVVAGQMAHESSVFMDAEDVHVDPPSHYPGQSHPPLPQEEVEQLRPGAPGHDLATEKAFAPPTEDDEEQLGPQPEEEEEGGLSAKQIASLIAERDRLLDERDDLRNRVQVLEAGRDALAKLPADAAVSGSLSLRPSEEPASRGGAECDRSGGNGSSLRVDGGASRGQEREGRFLGPEGVVVAVLKAGARDRPPTAGTGDDALCLLRDGKELSMEALGRKFADTQHKLRCARVEINELRRRLGELTSDQDENEDEEEDEVLPVDVSVHDDGQHEDDNLSGCGSPLNVTVSARTERKATIAAAPMAAAAVATTTTVPPPPPPPLSQASVNPFTLLDVADVPAVASQGHLPATPSPDNGSEQDGDDAEEHPQDTNAEDEDEDDAGDSSSTRAAGAKSTTAATMEENVMEDFGRKYVDAHHRLELAEEAKAALESEVAELRARIAELLEEQQQQQQQQYQGDEEGAVPARAPPLDPVVRENLEDADRDELVALIRSLESHIAQMDEQQEQELAELAEEAADRVSETEQYYQQRLQDLETALAAKLHDLDESHNTGRSNDNSKGECQAEEEEGENGDDAAHLEDGGGSQQRSTSSTVEASNNNGGSHDESQRSDSGVSATAERDEVAVLRDEVTRLREALDEVEAAMAHREQEHETDMRLVAEEVDKQFTVRDEQQEAHAALEQQLRDENEYLKGVIDQLQQELAEQRQPQPQPQPTEPHLSPEAPAAAQLPPNAAENDTRLAELQQQLAVAQEDAALARDRHDKLQARFQQLQSEYDAFLQDTKALRERQAEQQRELSSHDARNNAAAAQMDELRQHLREMEEQVSATREDVAERDARLRELQRNHESATGDLESRVRALGEQLGAKERALAEMTDAHEELSEMLKQGATSVETALLERQTQLDAALRQLREGSVQLAEAKDRLAQREASLEAQRAIEEDLRRQMLQMEAHARELEKDLRENLRLLQEEQRGSAQRTERLTRELERQQRGAASQLAELRDSHGKEVSRLQADLDSARDELQVAQTLAATLPLEGQKYQNQFEALKQQLAEALQSNNELHADLKSAREDLRRQRASLLRGGGAGETDEEGGSSDARLSALLARNELLEGRVRALTEERNATQQDRDALLLDVKNAERVAQVKEQAMRRQESELQHARAQMSAMRDDLAQRIQSQHAIEQELAHVTDHATHLAEAYEDLQNSAVEDAERCATLEEEVALWQAKAMGIPRLLEDVVSGIVGSYTDLVRVSQQERRRLDERCATIERTAMDAMVEGERQTQEYEAALADAKDEQAQLRDMVEDMGANLKAAEAALAEAVEHTKAARAEVAETKRRAHEDVFAAQRDRQAAELEHADARNQLSLLEEELATAARMFDRQKGRYEEREKELQAELEALRDKLRAMEAASKDSRERTGATEAAHAQYVEECVAAKDEAVHEARRLQAQLDRALPRLAQLEEERAARSAELMDTAQRLSALTQKSSTEGEVSRRHLGELNATLQQLSQAHAALQQAHSVSEAAGDRLRTQLASTEQDLQRATNKCDQQARELTATSAKLKELEATYARDTSDAEAHLRDAEQRLNGLEERNRVLQEEQRVRQEALHKANSQLATTTDSLRRLTDEHNALKLHQGRLIDSLRQRVSELEAQLASLQDSDDRLRIEHDACQRAGQQNEAELARVQQHLADTNRHNEALHRQLASAKEDHEAELAEAQEMLAEAQKELARCRKAIADAEAKQLEMEHTIYLLRGENSKGREEIAQLRAAADKAQEALQKEQFERQELATLLQNQIAQLYEEIRSRQAELKAQQQAAARLEDTVATQQRDIEEEREYGRMAKKDLERTRDEMSVMKEMHRRERNELQAQLDDALDAEDEAKRSLEQYKEKTTAKLEIYEVTEQNLRQEIVDLRADVAQLEDSLARTTHGKNSAETQGSRQGQSLRAAEEELRALRAQTAKDMADIADLRMQLQQRNMEIERARRDTNTLVMAERTKGDAARRSACEALETALKKERQATSEARTARDRALAALDQYQQEMEQQDAEDAAARDELRQLQRDADLLRHYVHTVRVAAGQAAREIGIPCYDKGDNNNNSSSVHLAGDGDDDNVDVQRVLDGLLDQLHVYTFAGKALDLEGTQLDELRRAGVAHDDLMRTVLELSGAGSADGDGDGGGVAGLVMDVTPIAPVAPGGSLTPVRGASTSFAGLNTSGATTGRTPFTAAAAAAAGATPTPTTATPSQALSSPSNSAVVQQIAQASATISHRLTDHVNTMQVLLRSLTVAMGTENQSSHKDGEGANTAAAGAALAANGVNTRALAAAGPRVKLLLSATTAEVHRRVGTASRALLRLIEVSSGSFHNAHNNNTSYGGGGASASSPSGLAPLPRAPGTRGPLLLPMLQDTLRLFQETEEYLLRPFNELLLGDVPSFVTAAAAAPTTTTTASGTTPAPSPSPSQAQRRRGSPPPSVTPLHSRRVPSRQGHDSVGGNGDDRWL